MSNAPIRVLLVDLNNFARYPSIAIGILVGVLREAGIDVTVYSPLSTGVRGVVREPRARPWSLLDQRLRYRTAISESPMVGRIRNMAVRLHGPQLARKERAVARGCERALDRGTPSGKFDVVLISTYLMYYPLCRTLCERCSSRGVPVLIGGPYFAAPDVQREWIDLPGMTALITGEVEDRLPEIVRDAARGGLRSNEPGVIPRGSPAQPPPAPLPADRLDALPFPDYSDFPDHLYPNVIIPIITGRGCSWGACTFCSDVTSTAGRTFRARSPENVLAEIAHQSRKHDTNLFVFTDLKLNSDLLMWRTLIHHFPVTDARWIASVHIRARGENGLSIEELHAARRSGLVRITTGLESGSQRVLDAMKKGTCLDATSRFLRDASASGISVRTTMILGYPGEEADDVRQSARFLRQHAEHIDRVSLNRFQIMSGTAFHRQLERRNVQSQKFPGLTTLTVNHRMAQIEHRLSVMSEPDHRRAVNELLAEVHAINRRPLRDEAREFDGVM